MALAILIGLLSAPALHAATAQLSWTAPVGETVAGYDVYRATDPNGPYTKLNTGGLITGTAYTDSDAPGGIYTYMLRTIKLEESGSGTYYNASPGIFATIALGLSFTSGPTATPNPALAGEAVNFTAVASILDGVTWNWNFGDSTSSTAGGNVAHVFSAPGTYQVQVVATHTAEGHTANGSIELVVTAPGGSGGATPPGEIDSDGDGVSDANEVADGTNPNDPNSVTKTPFTVTKAQLAVKFGQADKDSCAVSGVIPDLPPLFEADSRTVSLNVGGVKQTFTLDAKGKGKNAKGTIQLVLKPSKRNKTTKKTEFQGGPVAFKYKVRGGTWSDDWLDEGMLPDKETKSEAQTYVTDVELNGRRYSTPVTGTYAGKAGKGGKFKN